MSPCTRLRAPSTPTSLHGWIAVDQFGRPRYWATIWASALKAALSDTTRSNHLYSIERLYETAQDLLGYDGLDQTIAALDFDTLEAVLGAHFSRLSAAAASHDRDPTHTWNSARQFIVDILTYMGGHAEAKTIQISQRIDRIKRLYGSLLIQRQKPPAPLKALPDVVIEELGQIFLPTGDRNPFRTERLRWRNFLIFLMMLQLGIRRSELALLSFDSIRSDYDVRLRKPVFWLNISESDGKPDRRLVKPSLKTRRSARQIPIPDEIALLADAYVAGYRGRHPHGFLFSSQKGNPISLREINRIFEIAAEQLSEASRAALSFNRVERINTHNLRHTAAATRLSGHMNESGDLRKSQEKLRTFFGWEIESPMPKHYARAYFESDHGDMWGEAYQTLITNLKSARGNKCDT